MALLLKVFQAESTFFGIRKCGIPIRKLLLLFRDIYNSRSHFSIRKTFSICSTTYFNKSSQTNFPCWRVWQQMSLMCYESRLKWQKLSKFDQKLLENCFEQLNLILQLEKLENILFAHYTWICLIWIHMFEINFKKLQLHRNLQPTLYKI